MTIMLGMDDQYMVNTSAYSKKSREVLRADI